MSQNRTDFYLEWLTDWPEILSWFNKQKVKLGNNVEKLHYEIIIELVQKLSPDRIVVIPEFSQCISN